MNPLLKLLVGLIAAGLGFLLTTAIARAVKDDSLQAARAEFAQLEEREQQKLLSYAESLTGNDAEVSRLRQIHNAVTKQPELQEKLTKLAAWTKEQPSSVSYELTPDGEFADDWQTQVETKYREAVRMDGRIVFVLESAFGGGDFRYEISVPGDEFSKTIDDIVLPIAPLDDLSRLLAYPDQDSQTLAKCLWLTRQMMPGGYARSFEIYNRVVRLLTEEDGDTLTDWEKKIEDWSFRARRPTDTESMFVMMVLGSAMKHYIHRLQEAFPEPTEEQRIAVIKNMTREEQLNLMKLSPEAAKEQLNLRAIKVNQKDERVQKLLDDINLAREQFKFYKQIQQFRRSGPGGSGFRRPSGGPGGRDPDGRGPSRSSRLGEDRGDPFRRENREPPPQ